MELNGTEELKQYVKTDVFKLGTVKSTDVIEYSFDFLGNANDDIEYLEKSCGCTEAIFKDGQIKGHLDISKSGKIESGVTVTKYIYVYIKDGEPRFLRDEKYRKIPNPNKNWFRLQLSGLVK